MITNLPTTGKVAIRTQHSSYVFDMDEKVYYRTPITYDAAQRDDDRTAMAFANVCAIVGRPMFITSADVPPKDVATTPVQVIEPVEAGAAEVVY